VEQLESDLAALAREAAKARLPAVREAAAIGQQRLSAAVRGAKGAGEETGAGIWLEDAARPFLLACNHRMAAPNVVVTALAALQRLLLAGALPVAAQRHVLHVLCIQGERVLDAEAAKAVAEVEVKVLQTVPLLVLADKHAVSEDLLFGAISLCCRFHARDPGLAAVGLAQIVSSLFERVEADSSREARLTPMAAAAAAQNTTSATRLLEELAAILASSSVANGNSTVSSSSLSQSSSPSSSTSNSNECSLQGMPRSLALELLETILSSHSRLFLIEESYAKLVRNRICPVLVTSFGGRCDWCIMVRLLRTFVVLLCDLRGVLFEHEKRILVNQLLHMLDDGMGAPERSNLPRFVTPLWYRVLTLETLTLLCSDDRFLKDLQEIKDPENSVSLFTSLVNTLADVISKVVQSRAVAKGIDELGARPTKGLELLNEEEPPANLSESTVVMLATECLASITDGLALSQSVFGNNVVQLAKSRNKNSSGTVSPQPLLTKSSLNDFSSKSQSPTQKQEEECNEEEAEKLSPESALNEEANMSAQREHIRGMMEVCWKPILRSLALLLQCCDNENIVQFILKAYMSMTNTCGILDLVEARDTFILSLCNFSLPNWYSSTAILPQFLTSTTRCGSELQAKHLQALKALFNIAHGLGSILGSSWHILLETFEQLDHIMFCAAKEKRLTTSGSVHVTGMGPESRSSSIGSDACGEKSDCHIVDDEMAIVESMLRFLFDSTKYLNDEALIHMQTALTQLSFTALAHTETMKTSPSRSESPVQLRQNTEAESKQDGWISSTVINFTSSITSAASATLNSVAYEDEETSSDEGMSMKRNKMPDLEVDLTLEQRRTPQKGTDLVSAFSSRGRAWRSRKSEAGGEFLDDDGTSTLSTSVGSHSPPPNGQSSAATAENNHLRPSIDGAVVRATYRNPPFAIEKLVETTTLNIFRIEILWELTQNVLSTVASKSDPKLRLFGVHAMGDIVIKALLFEPEETSTRRSPRLIQTQLLEGFAHLFRSPHLDTREAAVTILHKIVGTCGHVLDLGWFTVIQELNFISGVVTREVNCRGGSDLLEVRKPDYTPRDVPKLVPVAFKTVQLVVDDFLSSLKPSLKKHLALCVCSYGRQEPLVNISLTSITMLWTICDQVQQECSNASSQDLDKVARAGLQACNDLLLFCMEELSSMAVDDRPEVRNCAVRTLCSVIVASAPKLIENSWKDCTQAILFPLVSGVISRGSNAPEQEVHGEVLGRLSNKRTRVHHSFDTIEKQWRETIVTTIQGTTRVVRAAIQFGGAADWAKTCWKMLLETIENLMCRGAHKRIAVVCARSLQELGALIAGSSKARYAAVGMQVVNGALVRTGNTGLPKGMGSSELDVGTVSLPSDTPKEELWGLLWLCYENVTLLVDAENEGAAIAGIASMETATELVDGLAELFANTSSPSVLRSSDMIMRTLALQTRLMNVFAANSKHTSSLERAVLKSISSFPPLPEKEWPILFNTLRKLMVADNSGRSEAFVEKAKVLFVTLFEKHAPSHARAQVFEETVQDLNSGMESRIHDGNSARMFVWESTALISIFRHGLRSLSTCGWMSVRVEDLWMDLIRVFYAFLGSLMKSSDLPLEDSLQLLDVVLEEARPLIIASRVPPGVVEALFDLLLYGCRNPRVSSKCLCHLTTFSAFCSSQSVEVSTKVLEALIGGFKEVVSSYTSKRKEVASDPQKLAELDAEMVGMLYKLRDLEVDAREYEELESYKPAIVRALGKKAHFLLLMPTLNEFVLSESLALREATQDVLKAVADSFKIH